MSQHHECRQFICAILSVANLLTIVICTVRTGYVKKKKKCKGYKVEIGFMIPKNYVSKDLFGINVKEKTDEICF